MTVRTRSRLLEMGSGRRVADRRLLASSFFEPVLDDDGALFSYNEQVTGVLRVDLAVTSH